MLCAVTYDVGMKNILLLACLTLFSCGDSTPATPSVAAEFAVRMEAVATVTDLEAEIQHNSQRISDIALTWVANPAPTQAMADGQRSMAAYLLVTADLVESGLEPDPPTPGDGLDTQLDGKPLPSRPDVDINIPRPDRYGAVINGGTYDFEGRHFSGVSSSGLLMKKDTVVDYFYVFASGGDGTKFDGGEFTGNIEVHRAHIFGIGLQEGAHADAFQGRGNLESALFKDCFMDIPTNAGDGTRSNACIIMSSVQGANGLVEFEDCILRGGNYTVMLGDKGSGNYAGDITFDRCAFIVEKDSPRYGFVAASSGKVTFKETCRIYYYCKESDSAVHRDLYGAPHADPMCHMLTTTVSGTAGTEKAPVPVTGFDFPAWHQTTFGRQTAR